MAAVEDLQNALVNADKAGDTEAAKTLANEIIRMKSQPEMSWSDVPGKAITNLPSSAVNFGKGIYEAVRHPIDTGEALGKAAIGGLEHAGVAMVAPGGLPQNQSFGKFDFRPEASAVANSYKQRYGSLEALKNTLATDPVWVLSDASVVASGGAGVAAKVPQLSKLSSGLRTVSDVTNPINAIAKPLTSLAPVVGSKIGNLVEGLGTQTGEGNLINAAKAGAQGVATQESFINNMRGKVPMTDVLDAAKANIENMGREKSAAYRQGMQQVSNDKTILDFKGIDNAVQNMSDAITYKGQVKNQKAAEIGKKITDEIENWKQLDPTQYHTPEGLDALKQRIGGIVESIPFEEKTARMLGGNVYNAIKKEIAKQAPVYADTMKGYSEASDQLREIERALSLGDQASVDTAMRKLQSLTRNNANTNYGNRLDLAKTLEEKGGNEMMPALSGQALNSWTPRGLGKVVAGGTGVAAITTSNPWLLPIMAAQSPRLMGETALKLGQGARYSKRTLELLDSLGVDPTNLNMLSQAGRLSAISPRNQ